MARGKRKRSSVDQVAHLKEPLSVLSNQATTEPKLALPPSTPKSSEYLPLTCYIRISD